MADVIRVINPNSNPDVTSSMSDALEPLRMAGGPVLECVTLEDGPFGIESQADVAAVEPLLARFIKEDATAAAFVIACYSDPGLALCREATDRAIFGIAECAILTALTRAPSFGVVSIASASIPRHMRHLRERLLHMQCVGDRPLELSVAEVEGGTGTFDRMVAVGRELRDLDGAGCIVMGCAGMAKHRIPLEDVLGIPVIDPVQAAAGMAISAVQLRADASFSD